jgi:hypothetical protein
MRIYSAVMGALSARTTTSLDEDRRRWLSLVVMVGAGVLVASLWLPRVELSSFEDFYGAYGGRLGIPEEIPADPRLDGLPGWFFPVPAAGQLLLAWLASLFALVVRLRPERVIDDRASPLKAAAIGSALILWILGAVVFFPGLDAPPMDRLVGTWIAAGSGGVAGVALLALAADAMREQRAQSRHPAAVADRTH